MSPPTTIKEEEEEENTDQSFPFDRLAKTKDFTWKGNKIDLRLTGQHLKNYLKKKTTILVSKNVPKSVVESALCSYTHCIVPYQMTYETRDK